MDSSLNHKQIQDKSLPSEEGIKFKEYTSSKSD